MHGEGYRSQPIFVSPGSAVHVSRPTPPRTVSLWDTPSTAESVSLPSPPASVSAASAAAQQVVTTVAAEPVRPPVAQQLVVRLTPVDVLDVGVDVVAFAEGTVIGQVVELYPHG